MRQDLIERALDACYEAVAMPELWPSALHQLAASMDAACAMFYPKDVGTAATAVPASTEYQPLLEQYVAQNWFANHYRAMRGWPLLHQGRSVVLEHDLASDEERKKIAVYNELYLKYGFPGFAAVGFRLGGQDWCVPFLRSSRQGFFTRDDAVRLAILGPHLRRFVSMTETFDATRLSAGLAALDKVREAAVLLDRNGHVTAMNPRAEALLAEEPRSLQLRNGRPHAIHRESDGRLSALISAALAGEAGTSRGDDLLPVTVEQPERPPLVIEAVSVSGIVSALSRTARTILVLKPIGESRAPAEARLQSVFGLTPAEARLAASLAAGENLRGVAAASSVSYETIRTRLKSVFGKTGVRRQADLVRLLSGMD